MPVRLPLYSAGTVILSLAPGEEKVVLVFNNANQEMQTVPKSFLTQKRFTNRLVELTDSGDAIVTFDQKWGFGTPFGKEEPEDNNDRVITALRETLEETGTSVQDKIIPAISYTEQPHPWSPYSNTVFLVTGLGFSFTRAKITDPLTEKRLCGFYSLADLPFHQQPRTQKEAKHYKITHEAGIYQAAVRRIVATLLQLNKELLAELGRPDKDNAEDLVQLVLGQTRYCNFFSHRMLKMAVQLKREDIILGRLKNEKGEINNPYLAEEIGRNVILWFSGDTLDQALEALINRAGPRLLGGKRNLESYLVERLIRKEKKYLVSTDKQESGGNSGEKEWAEAYSDDELEESKIVPTTAVSKPQPRRETPDYIRAWLGADEAGTLVEPEFRKEDD